MAEKLFKSTRNQMNDALVRKYTVMKGDTLLKIAEENGITVEELVKANRIADPDHIEADQVLLIPNRKEKKEEKKGFTKAK